MKKLGLAMIFVFGISCIPAPKAEAGLLDMLIILFEKTYGYELPKITPAPIIPTSRHIKGQFPVSEMFRDM